MGVKTHNKQGCRILQASPLIFHRYLAQQVIQTVAGILCAGLAVIFAGRLLQYMQSALEGKLEVAVALQAVLLRMPEFLSIFLPIAWVLGVYLAVSRLWASNEMSAAYFAFVSPGRVAQNILLLGGAVALTTFLLSVWLVPAADERAQRVLFASRTKSALLLLDPGLFHDMGNSWEMNVNSRKGNSLAEHLLIRAPNGGAVELAWGRQLQAQICSGDEDCSMHLIWPQGLQYARFSPSGKLLQEVSMDRLRLPLKDPPVGVKKRQQRAINSAQIPLATWLQSHLALPLFCLIAALLVLPLARVAPRQGQLHRLPLTLALMFAYLVLVLGAREWLEQGRIAPLPGIWPVHLAFLLLAGLLGGWHLPISRRRAA